MQQFEKTDKAYEEYAKAKGLSYLGLVVLRRFLSLATAVPKNR